MSGHAIHWTLRHRRKDLVHVLRPPVETAARSGHPKPPYTYFDPISKESKPIIYSTFLSFSHGAFLSMFFQVSF